jgi:hypothetical protein
MARPLGDDLYVRVCNVGIGFDRKIMKGKNAPEEQNDRQSEDHEPVPQGKID